MISCSLSLLLRIANWFKTRIEKTHSPVVGDIAEHELDNGSFVVQYIYSGLCVVQLMR